MSVGSNLQEMENVVTKGAAAAESMPKAGSNASGVSTPGQGTYEDLGGPTPDNYRADDDSAKLKEPTLATVKDIVNKGAKPAESMPKGMKEEEEVEGEVVSEEETTEEEVVSEEEEVVAEEEEVVAEYDIEEDINALLQGEELSEEFEEKARTIFEAAIKAKSTEIQEELTAQYEQALQEEVATIKEELTDRVDAYLEYVAEEWMTENQLAVEQGLKTEMTESFLTGIRSLFEDHYVSIPEEKYDVLNSMVEKLDEMEDKLNEQIERNIALKQRLAESVADVIFSENVEFDSEDTYREKLVTLRNSYFPANSGTQRDNSENISESADATAPVQVSGLMESYLTTLTRVAKK
jgi:hypothetical protein